MLIFLVIQKQHLMEDVFGSDKAFKYPMKKMWENEGRKGFIYKIFKSFKKIIKAEIQLLPRSLKERYEQLFRVEDFKKI